MLMTQHQHMTPGSTLVRSVHCPNSKLTTASGIQTPRPRAPDPMRPSDPRTHIPDLLSATQPGSRRHLFQPVTPHPVSPRLPCLIPTPHPKYHTLATTGACGNTTPYVLDFGPAKTPSSGGRWGCHPASQATSHAPHAVFPPTPHPTHPAPGALKAEAHPAGLGATAAHGLGEAPSPRYTVGV